MICSTHILILTSKQTEKQQPRLMPQMAGNSSLENQHTLVLTRAHIVFRVQILHFRTLCPKHFIKPKELFTRQFPLFPLFRFCSPPSINSRVVPRAEFAPFSTYTSSCSVKIDISQPTTQEICQKQKRPILNHAEVL